MRSIIISFIILLFAEQAFAYDKESCSKIEKFLISETDRSIEKPLDVWVDLTLGEILEIDGRRQSFKANFEHLVTWTDNTSLELAKSLFGDNSYGCLWEENDKAFLEFNFFRPSFGYTNKIDYDENKEFEEIRFVYYAKNSNYPASVELSVKKSGVSEFKTEFNYSAFPFDKQFIDFGMINYDSDYAGTWGHENITIRMQQIDPELLLKRSKNNVSGWVIGDPFYEKWIQKIDQQNTHTTIANVKKEITRNSSYYIFKVISPIFIILVMCWSVFWSAPNQLESRLTVTIVCFLSLIAYNYVIDDELPKLSYLTLMDYIILVSYIFAGVPTILSIIVHRLYLNSDSTVSNIDKFSRFLGPVLYLIIIYFLIIIIVYGNIDNSGTFLRSLTFSK